MDNCIVYVGSLDISKWTPEILKFTKTLNFKTEIFIEDNLEMAYDHFFNQEVSLIIIDSNIEGSLEAVKMIKTEEMTLHIPLLVFVRNNSIKIKKEFLLAGADQVLSEKKINNNMLFPTVRPLIMQSYLLSEKIAKNSTLQEKAINDFIMLDLIKAYIPKTIWKTALECAHMQKMSLPEEERELTIAFGDIKGFTKMSQHLPPKEVIATLNAVYEVVTRHIYENNGDVDKFIGDALFGIFAVAEDAIRSMILIQKELEKINRKRKKEELPKIQFRIGVHTGSVIRGNVGGHNRYDNTLIGDAVNTASRLESIAPGGDVMISDYTLKKAKLKIPSKYKSSQLLRGRDSEIVVYNAYKHLKNDKEFLNNQKKSK